MSQYSNDLWDRYKEVAKRFDNGVTGSTVFSKGLDALMSLHKSNGKALSKMKLKSEDYGGFGEVMKAIQEYFVSISNEDKTLCDDMKLVKDDILSKNKALKKELTKHHKNEAKAVKVWIQAKQKVLSSKKKDLADSLKWTKARQSLIESEQQEIPVEKKIEKNVKSEKKLRASSIKSRDNFERSVEELHTKDREYHESIRGILGEVEQVDVAFLKRQKEHLEQWAQSMKNYYTRCLEETQKLEEELGKVDPEGFIANFVEATKTGKEPEEPETFEPWIKDKAQYTEERPARRIAAPVDATSSKKSVGKPKKEKKDQPKSGTGKKVEVTFDYSPEGNVEGGDTSQYLELKQGDVIEVYQENDEGWWFGKLEKTGQEGYFPMNYIKEVGAETPEEPTTDDVADEPSPPSPKESKPDETSEYDVIDTVTSQADYAAQTESELTMKEGDEIKVFVKNEDGWWYGEIDGKRGYFPYNFTSAYTEE